MKIDIRKSKDLLPANYEIAIGGVRWGRLIRENMTTFRVQQEGSNRIVRHGRPGQPAASPVTLQSQSMYEKHHRPDHGPVLTLEQRAEALVRDLITEKKLIDPTLAMGERIAEEEAMARRSSEIKAAEQQKFENKALEVLREIGGTESPDNIRIVVAAMRSAQSW